MFWNDSWLLKGTRMRRPEVSSKCPAWCNNVMVSCFSACKWAEICIIAIEGPPRCMEVPHDLLVEYGSFWGGWCKPSFLGAHQFFPPLPILQGWALRGLTTFLHGLSKLHYKHCMKEWLLSIISVTVDNGETGGNSLKMLRIVLRTSLSSTWAKLRPCVKAAAAM